MKLNWLERIMLGTSIRVRHQIKKEAPKVLANSPCLDNCVSLEIGGGYGAGALLIKHYTGSEQLFSIDIDPVMVEKARRYTTKIREWNCHIPRNGIEFFEGDARSLPFEDMTLDAAFHFFVLDHIRDWEVVIHEIARVLKPGGIFSFADALFPDSFFLLNGLFGHVPITENELSGALVRAGFIIEKMVVKGSFIKRCYVTARKNFDTDAPQKNITS